LTFYRCKDYDIASSERYNLFGGNRELSFPSAVVNINFLLRIAIAFFCFSQEELVTRNGNAGTRNRADE